MATSNWDGSTTIQGTHVGGDGNSQYVRTATNTYTKFRQSTEPTVCKSISAFATGSSIKVAGSGDSAAVTNPIVNVTGNVWGSQGSGSDCSIGR